MKEQSGFRKGRSCMDNNFSAKQITVKGTEHNFGTHVAFIGFETHKKLIVHTELNLEPCKRI
jgi:hypothetical protein